MTHLGGPKAIQKLVFVIEMTFILFLNNPGFLTSSV